jgi:hypothetical protein
MCETISAIVATDSVYCSSVAPPDPVPIAEGGGRDGFRNMKEQQKHCPFNLFISIILSFGNPMYFRFSDKVGGEKFCLNIAFPSGTA